MSERDELDCAPCEIEQLEEKVRWQADRIREQLYLLDECERALVAIEEYIEDWQEIEALILIEKTLERLRGEKV